MNKNKYNAECNGIKKREKKENAPRARGPRRVYKRVGCWGGAPHSRTLVLAGLRMAETIQLLATSII